MQEQCFVPHFSIDPVTRQIEGTTKRRAIVRGDVDSELYIFQIPRYIGRLDMSEFQKVEIHYLNISDEQGTEGEVSDDVCLATNLRVPEYDPSKVLFDWDVSSNASIYSGSLDFAVSFRNSTDGDVTKSWSTGICSLVSVLETMNNIESVKKKYSDVLDQWKAEVLEELKVDEEFIIEIVDEYLKENPPEADGYISFEKKQYLTEEQMQTARDNIGVTVGVDFTTDATLTLNPETKVLSVNTADEASLDNTLPITSAAVAVQIGNIDLLLKTI